MIHGTKKWTTLTAAVLLSLSSLALPQIAWATDYANYNAGSGSSASYGDSTAVGGSATAAIYATALGANAKATGQSSTVLGSHATASGTWAIAVGNAAIASGDSATAIGFDSVAAYKDSVALGSGSSTSEEKTVSVGNSGLKRRIVNVADGTESSDVATFGQIALANQTLSLNTTATRIVNGKTVQNNQLVTNDGTVLATFEVGAVEENNTGFVSGGKVYTALQTALSTAYTGSDSISITDGKISVKNMAQSTADDTETVTNGTTHAKGINAIAFGVSTWSMADGALAIGNSNAVWATQSAAIGYGNTVGPNATSDRGTNIYAFGSNNTVLGSNSFVVGAKNTIRVDGANSFVIGSGNTLDVQNTFVFGSDTSISTFATNSVVLGYQSTVEDENTVSVGSGTSQRKIVHVANGSANTDAATYGQIAKTDQTVSLSAYTRETITVDGSVKEIKDNQLTTNDGTVLATFTKMENVAENDYGFVSGADLYKETRDEITSSNYISKDSSTAANLSALDTAIVNAKTALTLSGSDSITITDNTIRVKNMAQSDSTTEVTNGETKASGNNAIAFGDHATATGEGTLSIGYKNVVAGDYSASVGFLNEISAKDAYAFGEKNYITKESSSALGMSNNVYAAQSVAIGTINKLGSSEAGALTNIYTFGASNTVTESNSFVIGSRNTVAAENTFIFGSGVTVPLTATNSVVLGNGSSVEDAYTVSVGSDMKQRRIVHVADGTESSDAATYGQIAKTGQALSLSEDIRETIGDGGDAKAILKNQITTNDGTVLATFKTMDNVASTDYGFVSGADLYNETRKDISSSNYISQGSTTGANLNALDTAIGAKTSVTELYTTDDSVEAQMEKIGKKTIQSVTNAVSSGSTDTQKITMTTYDGNTSTIEIAGEGKVADGDVRLVNGDTVFDYVADIESGISGDVSTFKAEVAKLISYDNSENGTLHIGGGEGISAKSVSFAASDGATRKLTGISNGSANTDVATYGQLIKADTYKATSSDDASKVQTATLVSNDGTSKVSISIAGEGAVASGDKRLVDGGTVYTAIENAKKDLSDNISDIQTDIKASDASYVKEANKAGENLNALDSAIGKVELPEGQTAFHVIEESLDEDGNLKTSVAQNLMKIDDKIGTIAAKEDGSYTAITKDATISANLVALDEKLAEVSSDTTADLTDIKNKIQYEGATVTGTNAIGLGKGSSASGNDSISLGTNAAASEENAVALGNTAKATKANATALGNKAEASGASAVALGDGSTASGNDAISMGTGAEASGTSALAMGKGANASKENALAFGTSAAASADGAAALGNGAKAEGSNAISFGTSATASKENALAFGNDAKASEKNTLAFGNGAAASSENAMAFGNGASATGSGSVAIGSGSTASEANVVSFGAAGSERRLTNVAAGVNDTDAVNVGQMNSAIGENFNYLKSSLTRDINKVAAGSAALAALRPEGFDPDDKFSMAVGFGHYKNANAGAIGAFYKPNYDTTFSIGATVGDGETIMNMGVSFKLGTRGKRVPLTGAALSQEVASLRENNEALKKDNASQAKEIADLKADNERMKEQIAMILAKMELSDTVEKSVVK